MKLIDIPGAIHFHTEKAVLFSVSGARPDAVWLPRSQVEIDCDEHLGSAVVTLPEQLAIDKGLV